MIDPLRYGVSFSIKQCRNFGLEPQAVLAWLLAQGWRRFRLMSYWDEHEKHPGTYDFSALDAQLEQIAAAGGIVTLCLGAKQPRWPEYHWPDWAWQAAKPTRDEALLRYIRQVVTHYKDNPAVISWQLENEALLRGFGSRIEIDRRRLKCEFALVKQLDPDRPIIMSTSNGWGIPLRRPQPDIVGFSLYFQMYNKGRYHRTVQTPFLHRLRRSYIPQPVFIHELQCEPWGPTAIWKMSRQEQDKSMSPAYTSHNLAAARQVGVYPIDLWGGEWWYWRYAHGDPSIWRAVQESVQ